jgi:tetratricopeptide (TPR) repeat protein
MPTAQRSLLDLLADAREVYSVFGKPQRALLLVDEALAHAPQSVEALNLKAAILYDLDRDDEALAHHLTALALEPNSTEALHGLASIANDAGDYAGANRWAERGLAAVTQDPHPELIDNEDYRQRLLAELYNEMAFALWYSGKRADAMQLLTQDGPAACPLEVETFEDELDWLEHHPDSPDE